MGAGRDFMATLSELAQGEQDLVDAYARALFLYTNGALSASLHERYQTSKESVHRAEQALYATLQRALPEALMAHIEAPRALPDLPPMSEMPRLGGAASEPVMAGLAGGPLLWAVLIAGVILRIVQILAIVRVLEAGFDAVVSVFAARENTKRYKLEVQAQQDRFLTCVRRSGDIRLCAETFPTPTPPLEQRPERPTDPLVLATGILAGAVAVGGLGYLGYRIWRSESAAPSRVYRAKGGARRMSQRELRARLLRGPGED